MPEKCPVLKFIGYEHVVVLYKGSPAVAKIKSIDHLCRYRMGTNDHESLVDIYHINAPNNTVCDVEVDTDCEKKSKVHANEHYYSRQIMCHYIVASNIRVEN